MAEGLEEARRRHDLAGQIQHQEERQGRHHQQAGDEVDLLRPELDEEEVEDDKEVVVVKEKKDDEDEDDDDNNDNYNDDDDDVVGSFSSSSTTTTKNVVEKPASRSIVTNAAFIYQDGIDETKPFNGL